VLLVVTVVLTLIVQGVRRRDRTGAKR
jgi:hypothetical protein